MSLVADADTPQEEKPYDLHVWAWRTLLFSRYQSFGRFQHHANSMILQETNNMRVYVSVTVVRKESWQNFLVFLIHPCGLLKASAKNFAYPHAKG